MSDKLPERLDLSALNSVDAAPTESGLSWSTGAFLLEEAFGKLASALRWMFWGLVLQLAALAGFVAVALSFFPGKPPPPAVIFAMSPVMMLAGIGGLVLFWGEQRCLHLTLPLDMTRAIPGHGWLRAAYWCELAAILLRFFRGVALPIRPRAIALPLEILSLFFLLFFLRRIAIAIDRSDLRRLIHTIFALAGAALGIFLVAGVAIAFRRQITPLPGFVGAAIGLLILASVPVTLAVLLWRMGTAVRLFGEFLATVAQEESEADRELLATSAQDNAGPQGEGLASVPT
jgi:hypothetical protein